MKAIVQDKYGSFDALALRDIDRPAIADDEVLVRVRAASVHPDIWHVLTGRPYALRLMGSGLKRPKKVVPGTDLAGIVEAVGKDVTRFQPGDAAFGESIRGHQWTNGGAFAEYASAPEACLAHKPENVSFEAAAVVPTAGLIALHNLAAFGALSSKHKMLINGAGGGVGAIALQLVKAAGTEVTAVDHSDKLDLLRTLGADHVIDYTREDFTEGEERYDFVFDIPGNHSFSKVRRALSPEGKYVLIGHDHFGSEGRQILGLIPRALGLTALSPFVRHLPSANLSMPDKPALMSTLKEALEVGTLTPIIDKTFPLGSAAEALRYLAEGRPRGRIVLTI